MERSTDYVVGALAIWKAGAAYLPLDPASLVDHLRFILNDSGTKLVLSHQRLMNRRIEGPWNTLIMDQASSDMSVHSDIALEPDPKLNQLAYVVYTSGSTGRPKGAEIEHQGLLNLAQWHARAFAITPGDRASQFAGLGFDAAVWKIWPNLAAGASVHLVDAPARTVPRHFCFLDELPLGPSGKIDRSALPCPIRSGSERLGILRPNRQSSSIA